MKRSDFAYELPVERIAQEPRERGRSRMMVVTPRNDASPLIEHHTFDYFPQLLTPDDVLVINDTRVIQARLYGRPKGEMKNPLEFLLTRQLDEVMWESWCKPAKRVRSGDRVHFSDALAATVMEKRDDGTVVIRFEGDTGEIERIGVPPLPPYIAREQPRESDKEAYQTVYANARGAIAAPTAGLHFTQEILDDIASLGVEIVRITLHVGIGTFKPVKVDDIAEHRMDSERYEITPEAAARLNVALDADRNIVAVGTTSVRTLESAIREGNGRFQPGWRETSIFITPGFEFRAVRKLLTNFHLPESTLLMLVSAFAGIETIRFAYAEAVREEYFFYSYGDCMFLTSAQRAAPGAQSNGTARGEQSAERLLSGEELANKRTSNQEPGKLWVRECTALLRVGHDGVLKVIGSGFLLRIGAEILLVSAAHVFPERVGSRVRTFLAVSCVDLEHEGLRIVNLRGRMVRSWGERGDEDPYDVAAIKLNAEVVEGLRGAFPADLASLDGELNVTDVQDSVSPAEARVLYGVTGFPASLATPALLYPHPMPGQLSFVTLPATLADYQSSKVNPRTHLLLQAAELWRTNPDGSPQSRSTLSLRGMSGGPIWKYAADASGSGFFRIIGVVTEYSRRTKTLIGTRGAVVINLVRHAFPDLHPFLPEAPTYEPDIFTGDTLYEE